MASDISTVTARARYYSSFLSVGLARLYLRGRNRKLRDTAVHLDAAIQWICRAQDAAGDGGVSRSYSLVYNPYFGRRGWVPSYPETTGYIIPTLFDYARLTGRRDIADRAVRMADWECAVQMDTGAVQGGTIDQKPTPAIFNTGQVIFGWLRAFEETGDERYLRSAVQAGLYLLEHQSRDGAWRRNLSRFASHRMPFYTYNTRTAWALMLLSSATGDKRFREAAVRNIEFSLRHQRRNGWFESNCLRDASQPLLHTISYAIRGVFESGVLLGEERYLRAARTAADAVLAQLRTDGSLPGCFTERWEPAVDWSCLTGNAQIAGIWGRLFQVTGEERYLRAMERANRFLRSVQLMDTGNRDFYGGITGSDPLHGPYGSFEILNWAVKFFADSLMLELALGGRGDGTG